MRARRQGSEGWGGEGTRRWGVVRAGVVRGWAMRAGVVRGRAGKARGRRGSRLELLCYVTAVLRTGEEVTILNPAQVH